MPFFLTLFQWKARAIFGGGLVKSYPTLRDPTDQRPPGPPVFHSLPELGQIHVGHFNDPVQPSHPLMFPSPLAVNRGLSHFEETLVQQAEAKWQS